MRPRELPYRLLAVQLALFEAIAQNDYYELGWNNLTPETKARLLASMNAGRLLVVCGAGPAPENVLLAVEAATWKTRAIIAPPPQGIDTKVVPDNAEARAQQETGHDEPCL